MTDETRDPDFKKLFETAPGLFLVLQPDAPRFTIVTVSEAYLKVTLKNRADVLGRGLFEAFSSDLRNPYNPLANGPEHLRNSLLKVISTRLPDRMAEQTHGVRDTGEEGSELNEKFWSSVNTPVLDESGQVLNLIHSIENATFSNISQKKRLENERDQNLIALQGSEENNRLILESLVDHAIYLLDTSGRVLSWHAGAKKIKGYSASEVIGKSFSIFYSMEDVKSGKPIRDLRVAEAQGKLEEEATRFRKDGSEFWASVSISAIHDPAGALKGFVKVVRDISRQRDDALAFVEAREMLEARVKIRTQDLVRSNTELEQFAYIASHDLQTPLRHISSYVQLLTNKIRKTYVLDAKEDKWIEYILSGTLQMKSLISDLLAYSRIGRVDITVEEIDTSKLLLHVTDELRGAIRTTNAQLVYDEHPKIFGIRSQIEQLFQNLIENGIKFKKPEVDPIVKIDCKDHGDFWLFSVSDNGIGIEAKYAERIFLMFHRLHSTDQYEGTGIGLAICKKIIEFHGGKIWMDSAINQGSVFSFTLPKKERVTATTSSKESGLLFRRSPESLLAEPLDKRLSR